MAIDVSTPEWLSALHLYPTRKSCQEFNLQALNQTIKNNPNNDLFTIHSIDTIISNGQPPSKAPASLPKDDRKCGGLPQTLHLTCSSRVMLIRNIMAAQGLVNGANGTVTGFKANNKTIDTQGEQNPDEILVLFDDKSVGAIFQESDQHQPISINTIATHFTTDQGINISRQQFPLIQSWAVTIHKAQGMTLPKLVIDLGPDVFQPGMAYVGLSRVKSISDIALTKFCSKRIIPPTDVVQELERLHKKTEQLKYIACKLICTVMHCNNYKYYSLEPINIYVINIYS